MSSYHYRTVKGHGTKTSLIEDRVTTCIYRNEAVNFMARGFPAEEWKKLYPQAESNFFVGDQACIAIPTPIPSSRTLFNSCFDFGGNFRLFAESSDTLNKIAFGRDGRHFLAGIAWSALVDCIHDHRSPALPAWSESPRNVLDIGNAGETWLYQILKIQNVPTYVEDLRYFTLDVTGGQKDKDTLVSNAIPSERWTEIVCDAQKISQLNDGSLPESGFDLIHIAQASCELLPFKEYAALLESLYELLSPGGSLIFPVKRFDINGSQDPLVQAGTTYTSEIGSFTIGENVPIIDESTCQSLYFNSEDHCRLALASWSWFYQSFFVFYEKHSSDRKADEYIKKYMESREKMRLDLLSFFPDIRIRSTSIQLADTLFSKNSESMSARSLFTVTKPE